jgi:uncharacterized membrane protein
MGLIGKVMTGNYDETTTFPPVTGSSQINVGKTERIISIASGAVLAAIGLRKFDKEGLALTIAGGALVLRGASGFCPVNAMIDRDTANTTPKAITIRKSLIVNKPRSEVYAYWRQLENLPRFMTHLSEVVQIDNLKSKWKAKIPGDLGTLTWEAEILREDENQLLKWQSLPGSSIDNSGEVRFEDVVGGAGTKLDVTFSYRPPVGDVGRLAVALFNPAFEDLLKDDLLKFKREIEFSGFSPAEAKVISSVEDKSPVL